MDKSEQVETKLSKVEQLFTLIEENGRLIDTISEAVRVQDIQLAALQNDKSSKN